MMFNFIIFLFNWNVKLIHKLYGLLEALSGYERKRSMKCNICPRKCNADRESGKGFCGMGSRPVVARSFLHMWEEPCISGVRGSGTVFFSGCNLKCIFCQNHEISHGGIGREIGMAELAGIFLSLRNKGAHNINLVTPTHFVTVIKEALLLAKRGVPSCETGPEARAEMCRRLDIPVVYNTNGYDSIEALHMLEGEIDIYLPDLKYISPDMAMEYSGAADYFEIASAAVLEMYRQVGSPDFDENGMLRKGMIVRHLVLPGHTAETIRILEWIADCLPGVHVSLMSQYIPCYKACGHPTLGRRLTKYEYEKVLNKFSRLGLNGYVQERDSASSQYIPDFSRVEF